MVGAQQGQAQVVGGGTLPQPQLDGTASAGGAQGEALRVVGEHRGRQPQAVAGLQGGRRRAAVHREAGRAGQIHRGGLECGRLADAQGRQAAAHLHGVSGHQGVDDQFAALVDLHPHRAVGRRGHGTEACELVAGQVEAVAGGHHQAPQAALAGVAARQIAHHTAGGLQGEAVGPALTDAAQLQITAGGRHGDGAIGRVEAGQHQAGGGAEAAGSGAQAAPNQAGAFVVVGEAEAGARRIQLNHWTVDHHKAAVEQLQAQLWGRQGEAAQIQRLAAQVGELEPAGGLQRGAGGRVVGSGPKLQLPGVEGPAELQGAGGADHKRIALA